MSFSTSDFDKWMKAQGSMPDLGGLKLSEEQVKVLKNYPEARDANDLPFDVQQKVIGLKVYDNLQNEVDAFLENQYTLLSRKFKEHIIKSRKPIE